MMVLKASLSSACREKETSTLLQEYSFPPALNQKAPAVVFSKEG